MAFSDFDPKSWGLGGLVFLAILAIMLWSAKQFFGKVLQEFAGRSVDLVRHASGNRMLAAAALRRYRHAIQRNYAEHRLGFVETELVKIRQIYVPLEYETGGQRSDVYERVRNESRVVVIGPPGAGKSLLLKHSMLVWAAAGYKQTSYLPVLVELHSCNANERSLEELIEQALTHNQVRRGLPFVQQALVGGKLSVLFDGLDEVSRDDQDRVVAMLRDFARAYPDCQVVVTCRNAVYHGQLAPELQHRVRVADFDDASIRRFLAHWPGLPPDDATALFRQLQDSPQLMRLAANPLLLTMIAYLHLEVFAKSGRSLPTSRPAFYEIAIDHLLRRDHDLGRHRALSRYDGGDKKAILQGVALAMQAAPRGRPDRLSIDRKELIQAIKTLLPDLNIGSDHVGPLIDEIVERSQLLVKLDQRQSRYAFRHLTLQEHLAAVELGDDPHRLLARYFADPAGWRETVKLWCGASSRDCTRVVREIFDRGGDSGKVLALECLAEARRIDESYAQHVIGWAIDSLGQRAGSNVVAALGAVAADPRPRGKRVYSQLVIQAGSHRSPNPALALASTRLPMAAEFLGRLAERDSYARGALLRMGEQAIPALTDLAGRGYAEAVDDLARVGTPASAEALIGLLWTEREEVAVRAGWRIAELIRHADLEPALRRTRLAVAGPHATKLGQWVWAPCRATPPDAFDGVMERVADLLAGSGVDAIPKNLTGIDPRLAIPIGLVTSAEGWKYHVLPQTLPPPVARYLQPDCNRWSDVEVALKHPRTADMLGLDFFLEILRAHGAPDFQVRVLSLLPMDVLTVATRLVFCRSTPAMPSREQWRKVADKVDEPRLLKQFAWWFATPVALVVLTVGGLRAFGTMLGFWSLGPMWPPWLVFLATAAAVPLSMLWGREHDKAWDERRRRPTSAAVSVQYLTILLFYGAPAVSLVYATATVAEWIGWLGSGSLAGVLVAGFGLLLATISRRTRALDNPLRTIWTVARATSYNGASIIATQAEAARGEVGSRASVQPWSTRRTASGWPPHSGNGWPG